jgi:hypothetical protein
MPAGISSAMTYAYCHESLSAEENRCLHSSTRCSKTSSQSCFSTHHCSKPITWTMLTRVHEFLLKSVCTANGCIVNSDVEVLTDAPRCTTGEYTLQRALAVSRMLHGFLENRQSSITNECKAANLLD